MVDQTLVVLAGKWTQQITLGEHFGPDGNIVCDDAIARLRKRLRNASRA